MGRAPLRASMIPAGRARVAALVAGPIEVIGQFGLADRAGAGGPPSEVRMVEPQMSRRLRQRGGFRMQQRSLDRDAAVE